MFRTELRTKPITLSFTLMTFYFRTMNANEIMMRELTSKLQQWSSEAEFRELSIKKHYAEQKRKLLQELKERERRDLMLVKEFEKNYSTALKARCYTMSAAKDPLNVEDLEIMMKDLSVNYSVMEEDEDSRLRIHGGLANPQRIKLFFIGFANDRACFEIQTPIVNRILMDNLKVHYTHPRHGDKCETVPIYEITTQGNLFRLHFKLRISSPNISVQVFEIDAEGSPIKLDFYQEEIIQAEKIVSPSSITEVSGKIILAEPNASKIEVWEDGTFSNHMQTLSAPIDLISPRNVHFFDGFLIVITSNAMVFYKQSPDQSFEFYQFKQGLFKGITDDKTKLLTIQETNDLSKIVRAIEFEDEDAIWEEKSGLAVPLSKTAKIRFIVHHQSHLFGTDMENSCIFKINLNTTRTKLSETSALIKPKGLCITQDSEIFVAESKRVLQFNDDLQIMRVVYENEDLLQPTSMIILGKTMLILFLTSSSRENSSGSVVKLRIN